MEKWRKKRGQEFERGFTLVEIMVVVVIIGILAGLAIPAYQSVAERANERIIINNLRQLAYGAQTYMTEYGVAEVQVEDLVGPENWVHSIPPAAGETYPSVIRLSDTQITATGSHFGDISIAFD